MALFRRLTRVILSLAMATQASTAVAWDLDYDHIFSTIASSTTPLDERILLEYRKIQIRDSTRGKGLDRWLQENHFSMAIDTYLKTFKTAKPELFAKLKTRRVGDHEIIKFYAESLLLFSMLRNGRPDLINWQLMHWVQAWTEVDFRRLGKNANEEWSSRLVEILGLAFQQAGPWSNEQIAKAQSYMDGVTQLQSKQNRANFRHAVRRSQDQGSGHDPGLDWRVATYSLAGGVGSLAMSVVGFGYAAFYAPPLLEQLNLSIRDLPFLYGFPLALVTLVIWGTTAIASTVWSAVNFPLIIIPISRNKYSYMLRDGVPSCQELLAEGVQ